MLKRRRCILFPILGSLVLFMGAVDPTVNSLRAKEARAATELALARPGEILFVRAERRRRLAGLPAATREKLCRAPVRKWRSTKAVTTIRATPGYGGDNRTERFALTVMQAGAAAFGAGDRKARRAVVRLIARWAKGRAMTKLEDPEDASSYYVVERTLLPTIVTYWLTVRGDTRIKASTRARIERWLEGLVRRSRETRIDLTSDEVSARNNHAYLAAGVVMAWGALTGDLGMVETAVAVYRRAIAEMRPDGSFPLETMRGARALWYQRHAVASLTVIAEMAAVQGIDLYGYRVGKRDLHRAVAFLLDGIEDPKRVWRYAKANVNPGPIRDYRRQDLGFLRRRAHGRHYMAWAEIYMARFPERAESRRLAALLAESQPDFRPMVDEYSGGNTSCFFYTPPGAAGNRAESGQRE